ncbi:MAG: hypothetical protein NXI03_11110 [Alphaproteobacteria bacterium]|uniref:hypothetical protein n=1 Tax=Maricaulis alexandrii TaxID=2570354 RepID=UPI001108D9D0|nr:hypothetical protein [Maricaulis alexandrii]MCR9268109.1 hypothetical protein [Alphaproteobacteria bacterium]
MMAGPVEYDGLFGEAIQHLETFVIEFDLSAVPNGQDPEAFFSDFSEQVYSGKLSAKAYPQTAGLALFFEFMRCRRPNKDAEKISQLRADFIRLKSRFYYASADECVLQAIMDELAGFGEGKDMTVFNYTVSQAHPAIAGMWEKFEEQGKRVRKGPARWAYWLSPTVLWARASEAFFGWVAKVMR